jgi:CheY-like chemotaxis protein
MAATALRVVSPAGSARDPSDRRVSMPLLQDVHVLVVDDEAEVRDVICDIFEIYGATVSSAPSGEEAIGFLAARTPDVIVTDIAMARGDGFWLLREVRGRGYVMPVIAISGHFDESERERVLAAGFDAVVQKPLQFDDLVQIVARSTGR